MAMRGRLTRTLDRQARLLDEYEQLGGPGYEGRVRSTLRSLGFAEADLDLPVEVLSGGQKKLVGLAKLLVTQPDLLLLDEPDNHLDLDGQGLPGALHPQLQGRGHHRLPRPLPARPGGGRDRRAGGWPADPLPGQLLRVRLRESRCACCASSSSTRPSKKRSPAWSRPPSALMTWGKRRTTTTSSSGAAQSMLKRLERMERIEQPVLERRRMGLELNGWRGSNKVLEIVDLDKAFPAHERVERATTRHRPGRAGSADLARRAGGPGRSQRRRASRCSSASSWARRRPAAARSSIGPSVEIGYYAQEHETLDYERTLIETVRQAAPMSESDAVRFLGRFLFTYEQARGQVANLSGGERSRLQMALLMLSDANFLLLDEPTNNLDIPSAEVLEDALAEFRGHACWSSPTTATSWTGWWTGSSSWTRGR